MYLQLYLFEPMGKRDTNVAEANLPAPPDVQAFVQTLRDWEKRQNIRKGKRVDPIHGEVFANDVPSRRKGTIATEKAGVQCALAFAKLCEDTGAQYDSLDNWAQSWGQWVVAPIHLCEKDEDIARVRERRKESCVGGRKEFALPVGSFKTYVNACGRVYTAQSGNALVMSARKQLPEFVVFCNEAVTRARKRRATMQASKESGRYLTEDEFRYVMGLKTKTAITRQRQNILGFAYCTGLRASSIARLQVNSFRDEGQPGGKRMLRLIIGNMKNLPAELDKCEATLFHQVIVQGEEAALCPIAAVEQQKAEPCKDPGYNPRV